MLDQLPSSSSGPIRINESEFDVAMSNADFLTQTELLHRRSRRLKQLDRIYRDHYWAIMKELKLKHREYYWEYGKSPFTEDEKIDGRTNSNFEDYSTANVDNVNGNFRSKCGVLGCKAKAMALTRFCHMHILSDSEQKLYKACSFSIKSSAAGPILCGKPILGSTVPSYCSPHFQKAEKIMARALKNGGANVSFTSNLTPTFHVFIAEYVHQIQTKSELQKRQILKLLKSRRLTILEAVTCKKCIF